MLFTTDDAIMSYNGSFKELHVQASNAAFTFFRNCHLIYL